MRAAKDRRHRGDEMRAEYGFSGGVRGKYAARVPRGASVVVLDPDVARVFTTAKSVNSALRSQLRKRPSRKVRRASPRR